MITAIPFLIALFIPFSQEVVCEEVINRDKKEIFEFYRNLRKQTVTWSMVKLDPKIRFSHIGEEGQKGSIIRWASEHSDVGYGQKEILHITDSMIDFRYTLTHPKKATNLMSFKAVPIGEHKSKVYYSCKYEFSYPINLVFLFVDLESKLSEMIDSHLHQIKVHMEQDSLSNSI
jgi:hypothetical protein